MRIPSGPAPPTQFHVFFNFLCIGATSLASRSVPGSTDWIVEFYALDQDGTWCVCWYTSPLDNLLNTYVHHAIFPPILVPIFDSRVMWNFRSSSMFLFRRPYIRSQIHPPVKSRPFTINRSSSIIPWHSKYYLPVIPARQSPKYSSSCSMHRYIPTQKHHFLIRLLVFTKLNYMWCQSCYRSSTNCTILQAVLLLLSPQVDRVICHMTGWFMAPMWVCRTSTFILGCSADLCRILSKFVGTIEYFFWTHSLPNSSKSSRSILSCLFTEFADGRVPCHVTLFY